MLVIVWLTWKIQFCFDNSLDLDIFFVVLVVACDELLQWRHLTCCEPCNQKLVGADGRQQYKVPSERKFRNVNMYQHETIHECLKFVCASGPFIYYVITFLGFLDPLPPLRQHVFSTKNKQKLAFSDPPSPLQVLT